MFTPRTPRPKFIAFAVAALLALPFLGKAQTATLAPLPEYEASLRAFHTARVSTQCIEFQASVKKKWWYYIPQLGFNFGLPTINGGTNTFVTLDVQKQQNRVKLASLISQGMLDFRTELHQLRSMYAELLLERDALTELETSWHTTDKIFRITEEAHNKKEIKPVEFYQALQTYQQGFSASEARERLYKLKIIELARFARHQFPTGEGLPGLDSLFLKSAAWVSSPARQRK